MTDTLLILGRKDEASTAAPATLGQDDPFGSGRHILFQDTAGFAAGHVTLTGVADVPRLTHAEVIVLARGGLTLRHPQGETKIVAGGAFVLPRGFSGQVLIEPDTLWYFNAIVGNKAVADAVAPVMLDPALPRPASPGPAAEVLVGPAPECHSLNFFTDPSGLRAGVWDVSTPCERSFVPHRVHELMHFIEGEVTLRHASGAEAVFSAGDTILVPRGAPYAWINRRRVVKYYCVL